MFQQKINRRSKVYLPKVSVSKSEHHVSIKQMLAFVIIFAAIGGYFIWNSSAATSTVATLQTEQMALPSGTTIYNDSTASAGQAVKFSSDATANGAVTIPSGTTATSLSVTAHGNKCHGWATMTVRIDGNTVLPTTSVSSSNWANYNTTVNIGSGAHNLSVTAGNTSLRGNCNRSLYLDVSTFYSSAPTSAPTLVFSASPTSVNAGGSSTLTWTSTNASSCTASGAWSGVEPTSGSASTGALNATSTYGLTCTGDGGSANASVVVTVGSSATLLYGADNVAGWGTGAMDDAKNLGINFSRREFDYAASPSGYDTVFTAMAQRGLRIQPLINGDGDYPSDQTAFANYVAAFVKRYGPSGDFWKANPSLSPALAPTFIELWNEPYGNWRGTPNASAYANAVKAAAIAGRAANPSAKYLISAQYETWYPAVQTWIDDMYAAVPDLNNYFDGASVHPYNNPLTHGPTDTSSGSFIDIMNQVRQRLVKHNAGDKPFWITEVGWSTCPSDPNHCVNESTQATYVGQLVDVIKANFPYVQFVNLFQYHDYGSPAQDPTNREQYFGLNRLDGTHKPSWQVYYNKIHGL